jgi:hypothetical protein
MEYTLQDVKSKLINIQKNEKEPYLFPYLQQLYNKIGFNDVIIHHGKDEYGKDLVFSEYDAKLNKIRYTAVVVKNKDAGMKDFEEGGEIMRQIKLSFDFPFLNNSGQDISINSVIVVVNGSISFNARQIMNKTILSSQLANIEIWSYQELANHLHKNIPNIFLSHIDPKINRFLKYQEEQFVQFNLKSEFYSGLSIKDINDIYVNVRTTLKRYQETKNTYSEYGQQHQFKTVEELDDSLAIANSSKSYIIHGVATSGKSLLLRRIGYNSIVEYKSKPVAPFYIELFNIVDCKKVDFFLEIEKIYKDGSPDDSLRFEDYSKICVLLDGIDEIIDPDHRVAILEKINQFEIDFRATNKEVQLQIVMTTRDIQFIERNNLLKGYETVELLPFDVGQALKLVQKLIPGNKAKAESFVGALKNNQLSNNLTRTPMALSLMAILYREEVVDLDELPANITELYNKFTDYYLNRWDTSKGISLQYKYEETKQILALIAKELHTNGENSIHLTELNQFLKDVKKDYNYEELENIEHFLTLLKERAGILRFNEMTEKFTFNHLAFQEYFVSVAYDDSEEDELIENFFDNWWENVLIFYCGKQPKRDVLLKKINKTIVPTNVQQLYQYLTIISKAVQAGHLIQNSTKKLISDSLLHTFDGYYKAILAYESAHQKGLLFNYTTLDFILYFRDFFKHIFSSKHLNQQQLKDVLLDFLLKDDGRLSDMTKYAIAYYLSHSENDATYLQEFIKDESLNVRWQRIIFVDLEHLKKRKNFDEKLLRNIKKKQLKYKSYIQLQLKQGAYKHLLPLVPKS